jgi:magnesium transporter
MDYFSKRYHAPGTAPGTLTPSVVGKELKISLIDYSEKELNEVDLATTDLCKEYLARPSITWIHIQGHAVPDTLRNLGNMFGLHSLALEDVLNSGQRPKAETYDNQLFVIMSLPTMHDDKISVEQVSFFHGDNFVISIHQGEIDPFEEVRKRLRITGSGIRKHAADFLLYSLLDVVIDTGFPILENFGELIEDLEEELLESPTTVTLRRLHLYKRELLLLRRMLWPQRDALNTIMRSEHQLIKDDTRLYLRDCYDHTIQIMDLLESFRDMTTGMLDVYLSSTSNRMNETMRILTVIATIFIPLTFIAGIYGMNFKNDQSPWSMPELGWYYGYPIIWLVMIVVAGGLLYYFKRKGWF